MEQKIAKLLVYRKAIDSGEPRYERYEVPVFKGMNVLEALFYIQDHYDSSFAFRYACRGAICGSCGVTIDKIPQLACRAQMTSVKTMKKPVNIPEYIFGPVPNWDPKTEILIEPLPNMRIIKDLIVDMTAFWKFYRETQPYFTRRWNDVVPESTQKPQDAQSIEHLIYCILCGVCWACPVNAKNSDYYGPAALAKGNRFLTDTRTSKDSEQGILASMLRPNAVEACEKFFVCNRVCPKGVLPGTAIQDIRKKYGLKDKPLPKSTPKTIDLQKRK